MSHNLYKGYIDLNNRRLWCDGSISVDPSNIIDVMLHNKGIKIYTTTVTKEIVEYNKYADSSNCIIKKQDLDHMSDDWVIPNQYMEIDIRQIVYDKLFLVCGDLTDEEYANRIERIQYELKVFNKLNLFNLLRTLVYVVDEFTKHKVIWGVGRGSSVASYVLYVIGIHDIDCIAHDLDLEEFDEFLH